MFRKSQTQIDCMLIENYAGPSVPGNETGCKKSSSTN